MIEENANGRDPFKVIDEVTLEEQAMFTAERDMYGDILEDLRTIMTDYFAYWQPRDLVFLPVDGQYAEHDFEIELDDGILFKGQVDGLGTTPSKLKWLVENKTFDKLPSDDHRWRNLQSVVYVKAIEELGWVKKIDGVCWNYIKSHAPTIPEVVSKGTRLSKSKITTLPSVVRRVLKENNLSEADHKEQLEHAEQSRDQYFQRIFTPLNRTTVDNIFNGFVETAIEMRDNHGKKKDKNLGRGCEWCDYEPICRAELTGGDVDFVKEREFNREDPEAYRAQKGKLKVVK
jgi:hypothetical protein